MKGRPTVFKGSTSGGPLAAFVTARSASLQRLQIGTAPLSMSSGQRTDIDVGARTEVPGGIADGEQALVDAQAGEPAGVVVHARWGTCRGLAGRRSCQREAPERAASEFPCDGVQPMSVARLTCHANDGGEGAPSRIYRQLRDAAPRRKRRISKVANPVNRRLSPFSSIVMLKKILRSCAKNVALACCETGRRRRKPLPVPTPSRIAVKVVPTAAATAAARVTVLPGRETGGQPRFAPARWDARAGAPAATSEVKRGRPVTAGNAANPVTAVNRVAGANPAGVEPSHVSAAAAVAAGRAAGRSIRRTAGASVR